MAIQVLNGPTILAGESISNVLTVTSGGVYRIIMPDVWTEAEITFQLSYNGTQFYNVLDRSGAEVVMGCQPTSVVAIGEYLFYIHSLRIRSGTWGRPIKQDKDASFKVVLETKAALELATDDDEPITKQHLDTDRHTLTHASVQTRPQHMGGVDSDEQS